MLLTLFNIFKLFSETFDNLIEMIPLSDESEIIDISENSFLEVAFQYVNPGEMYGHAIVHITEDFITLVFEPIIDINIYLPFKTQDDGEIKTQRIETLILKRIEQTIQLKYKIEKQKFLDKYTSK